MHLFALFYPQHHHMPRLSVVQCAGQAQPVKFFNRRGKALHDLTAKEVKCFRVFFNAEQTAFGLGTGFEVFGIAHANHHQTAIGIAKGADGFKHSGMFVADALELQRTAFR